MTSDLESAIHGIELEKLEKPAFQPYTGSMTGFLGQEFGRGRFPAFDKGEALEQLGVLELLLDGTVVELDRSNQAEEDPIPRAEKPLRMHYDASKNTLISEENGAEVPFEHLNSRYTVFLDEKHYRDVVATLEQERAQDRTTAAASDLLFAAEHEKWTPALTGVETFVNLAKIGYFTPETEVKVYNTDGSEEVYRYGPGVGELTGANGVLPAKEVLERRAYEIRLDPAHVQKVWNDVRQRMDR